ncbi:kinase-like domain-containing protein [Mycena pura]|uniref:mitogen-activated protein kinase kinase n=1 Tax=Mycena pura TaxID=153505 RepID=A0AAD6ULB8_9AGAR|nr:kinase-like domain-containing protein [Mycena pura]
MSTSTVIWSDDVLEEIQRLDELGAVHKVKDKHTGKIMVRKTIAAEHGQMEHLQRELFIISSFEHINIISFHGTYIPSSPRHEVKILIEFCGGGSLDAIGTRIKECNAVIGESIASRLAEGILQGLAYLDTKRIIHREIKPSNILISREGIVKLSDIGITYGLVNSFGVVSSTLSRYVSPERICGLKYTIRSDVWSTGVCLLELVQNRYPFPSDLPPIELMMYITSGDSPQLEDNVDIQWSPDMKDFFKKMLNIDGLTRPTPTDMLAHPWVVNNMKQPHSPMARWIRMVWGWPRDESSSAQSDSSPLSGIRTESPHASSDSRHQT